MNSNRHISFYEYIWIFLGIIGAIGILLLAFNYYSSLLTLSFSVIIFSIIAFILRKRFTFKDSRFGIAILLIIILALCLRIAPWPYLEGGQDEGVYMSLSSQLDTSTSFKFKDISEPFLNEELKNIYLENRSWSVLGMKKDSDTGNLFYDFYPLHPIYMSVTASLFGDSYRIYSLTLFSLLSITGAYLLTNQLTKKKNAGLIVAGILTVMPLHVYFSRFPVTEIIALAVTLNFLYFVLKAYQEKRYIFLWISLLLVNIFLYLRLTWVVSLPISILIVLLVLIFSKDNEERNAWSIWGILHYFIYLLSILFYYVHYNYILEHFYGKIYKYIPEPLFFGLILLLPVLVFFIVKYLKEYLKKIFLFIYNHKYIVIWAFLFFVFIYSAYQFYKAGFTPKYLKTPLDWTWGIAMGGWYTIKDQILVSVALHASPFVILAFLLLYKQINSIERFILYLFLMLFIVFNIIVIRFTPYQFYYARYQLSEIIPIFVIFAGIFISELPKNFKWLKLLFLISIFSYNIFFVSYQFQGYVGTTSRFFNKLGEYVAKTDFIIYYDPTDWSKSFLFSPLKYYYNFPSLHVDNEALLKKYENGLLNENYTLYILSTVDLKGENYKYIDTIKYERGFYANAIESNPPLDWIVSDNTIPYCTKLIPYKYCGGLIPIKYHKGSINIMLYEYTNQTSL